MSTELIRNEQLQIADILKRRANEIARFSTEYKKDKGHFGSVELALTREIDRLRTLAERICPVEPEEDE